MRGADMALLGRRHHTSKCHSLKELARVKTLGFRGEAFASIVNLGQFVKVTSRARFYVDVYGMEFSRGRVTLSPTKIDASSKYPSGTTVKVQGARGGLPTPSPSPTRFATTALPGLAPARCLKAWRPTASPWPQALLSPLSRVRVKAVDPHGWVKRRMKRTRHFRATNE